MTPSCSRSSRIASSAICTYRSRSPYQACP
jgi:hypothetical protein